LKFNLRFEGRESLAAQKSGALGPEINPGTAEVVNAWPMLSPAVRAGILAMVRASMGAVPRAQKNVS